MRYLSVCSGIEAASVAWKHLGWKAVALSEIEKFPCEVLKHHYPDVPNLGDMTLLTKNEYLNGQQIDLLVGGTPCQSFSVAGLRAGLADERGNLSLEYIRLLEHKRPKWFLWENVPGVLSSNGGADFASILSGWTGRDIAPQSFGISGVIEGQFYSVAWRVLDSRHFGVPQRRRRVFVVGYIGKDWRPPVAVLFERESLRRDFTPSRGKRQKSTTSAERGSGAGNQVWPADVASTLNTKFGDKMGLDNQHINEGAPLFVPVPAYGIQAGIVNRTENSGANGLGVKEEESFTLTKGDQHCVMQPIVFQQNQREEVRVMGDNVAGSLVRNAGVHNQNYIVQPIAFKERGGCEGGGKGYLGSENLAFTLSRGVDQAVMQPIVYDTTQITHPKNGSNPKAGDPCHTLAKGGDAYLLVQPIERPTTFRAKITLSYNGKTVVYQDTEGEKSGVILDGEYFPYYHWKEGNMSCDCNLAKFVGLTELPCGETIEVIDVAPVQPSSSYNTVPYQDTIGCLQARDYKGVGNQYVAEDKLVIQQPIILDDQGGNVMTVCDQGHVGTLRAQTHGHEPIVCLPINTMTVQGRPSDDGRMGSGIGQDGEPQNTITKGHSHAVFVSSPLAQRSMVRRLTPLECCRLQGFPDDYMDGVPNASDSKWYAAFGNSMTVNVMKWIGERIDNVDKIKRNL